MPISEVSHEYQPKDAKWLSTPEYIVAYNDAPNFTTFLGGAIVSRVHMPYVDCIHGRQFIWLHLQERLRNVWA
jgi:hypothetical protein